MSVDPRLKEIWRQKSVPVIFRRPRDPLLVKLPYASHNFEWLRGIRRHKPVWVERYRAWETPASWFDEVTIQSLKRFDSVYVIQPHRPMQKCARACWEARGFKCECSCMGKNHGSGDPGHHWHEVSETFAYSWKDKTYACRLMKVTPESTA